MSEIKNYSHEELKNAVTEKYKKIDKNGVRDDQEVYQAGMNQIKELKNQLDKSTKYNILKDKNGKLPSWITEDLTNIENKLKTDKEKVEKDGYTWITGDRRKMIIANVASWIDHNENILHEKLTNALNQKENEEKANGWYTVEKGGDLRFTAKVNKPKIQDVMVHMFANDPNKKYQIDYSQCHNSKICNKMRGLIGSDTCYVRFDKTKGTYMLQDHNGKDYSDAISQRALVWEGVIIRDMLTVKSQANVEARKKAAESKQLKYHESDKTRKHIEAQLPGKLLGKLKDMSGEYKAELLEKTEARLDHVLTQYAKAGYELQSDSASKLTFGTGLMELHFISGDSEVNEVLWHPDRGNIKLSEKLYDMLDDNEGEYLAYITQRIQEKWSQLDNVKPRANILTQHGDAKESNTKNLDSTEQQKSAERKQTALNGLKLFKQFIDNHKKTEGDSLLDDDDKDLVTLSQYIDNSIHSLNQTDYVSEQMISDMITNKIATLWLHYETTGASKNNPNYYANKLRNITAKIKDIFQAPNKAEQIKAMRSMGGLIDKSETSFLQDEIAEEGLEFGQKEFTECFKKIDETLNPGPDGFSAEQKTFVDKLYSAKNGREIAGYIEQKGFLPKKRRETSFWKDDIQDELIEKLDTIKQQLDNNKKVLEAQTLNETEFRNDLENKILMLKQKGDNLTDDERSQLQASEYMLTSQGREILNQALKNANELTHNHIKYGNIGMTFKKGLAPVFADHGGGAKGINANIFNDIVGVGALNFSDETVKGMIEGAKQIAIEIAIMIVVTLLTAGTATAAVSGARVAAMGARLAAKGIAKGGAKFIASQIMKIGSKQLLKLAGKAIVSGALHTTLSKAVRGTLDDDTNKWLTDIAKNSTMYLALQGVAQLKAAGKLDAAIKTMGKNSEFLISGLLEETGQITGDTLVDVIVGNDPLPTGYDIIKAIAMGVAFEGLSNIKLTKINGKGATIDVNGKPVDIPKQHIDQITSDIKNKKIKVDTDIQKRIDDLTANTILLPEKTGTTDLTKPKEKIQTPVDVDVNKTNIQSPDAKAPDITTTPDKITDITKKLSAAPTSADDLARSLKKADRSLNKSFDKIKRDWATQTLKNGVIFLGGIGKWMKDILATGATVSIHALKKIKDTVNTLIHKFGHSIKEAYKKFQEIYQQLLERLKNTYNAQNRTNGQWEFVNTDRLGGSTKLLNDGQKTIQADDIQLLLPEATPQLLLPPAKFSKIQPLDIATKAKFDAALKDQFTNNIQKLKDIDLYIEGQKWKFTTVNNDGSGRWLKKADSNDKVLIRNLDDLFGKKRGQINAFPDQNPTNGNKFTLSEAEKKAQQTLEQIRQEYNDLMKDKPKEPIQTAVNVDASNTKVQTTDFDVKSTPENVAKTVQKLSSTPTSADDLALTLSKADLSFDDSFKNVKLDWATKTLANGVIFLDGVGKWMNKLLSKSTKVSALTLKKIRDTVINITTAFGNQIKKHYEKFVALYKQFIEKQKQLRKGVFQGKQKLSDGSILEGKFENGKLIEGKRILTDGRIALEPPIKRDPTLNTFKSSDINALVEHYKTNILQSNPTAKDIGTEELLKLHQKAIDEPIMQLSAYIVGSKLYYEDPEFNKIFNTRLIDKRDDLYYIESILKEKGFVPGGEVVKENIGGFDQYTFIYANKSDYRGMATDLVNIMIPSYINTPELRMEISEEIYKLRHSMEYDVSIPIIDFKHKKTQFKTTLPGYDKTLSYAIGTRLNGEIMDRTVVVPAEKIQETIHKVFQKHLKNT